MEKQLAFVDLETTGTDVSKDRIVQIAAVKTSPDLMIREDVKNYLVNPGIPIPKEASDIHNITDDKVKDAPTFRSLARGLYQYLEGCDIAGFGSNGFDVPLLSEEFARVGVAWPAEGTRFLDALSIAREKEPRDLTWALQYYCGRTLENAHDAEADILATVDVLGAQILRYEDLTDMNIEQLHDFCGGKIRVDLAGTIVLNDYGVAVYNIGKAKGKPVVSDRGFGQWMLKGDFCSNTKAVVRRLLGL